MCTHDTQLCTLLYAMMLSQTLIKIRDAAHIVATKDEYTHKSNVYRECDFVCIAQL